MWWRRSRGACSRRAVPHVVVPLVAEEPPASRHAADCGAAGWIGVRLRHAAAHGGIPRDAIGHVCRAMSHSGVSLVTEGAPVSRHASDCGTARRGWSASVVRCRTVVYLSSREGFQCRALPRVVVALVVEGALVSRVAGWCGAAGRIGGCLRRASPQVLVKRMWWGDWSLEAVRVVWCGCRSTRVGAGVVSSCIVWRRWSWWHGRVVCCLSWRGIATRRWWLVFVGFWGCGVVCDTPVGCVGGGGWCRFSSCCRSRLAGLSWWVWWVCVVV